MPSIRGLRGVRAENFGAYVSWCCMILKMLWRGGKRWNRKYTVI